MSKRGKLFQNGQVVTLGGVIPGCCYTDPALWPRNGEPVRATIVSQTPTSAGGSVLHVVPLHKQDGRTYSIGPRAVKE